MKRPNIDRMRKHAARNTPDKVSRLFSEKEIDRGDHDKWIMHYVDKIKMKYGTEARVDSESHRDFSNFTVLIVLTAIYGEELANRRRTTNQRMRQIMWDGV